MLKILDSPLIKKITTDDGKEIFKMASFNIDVIAKMNGGLAPVLLYFYDNQDVTDDIRKLRFSPIPLAKYVEDYEQFQRMLYEKEQQAIQNLYDKITIRPKNMTTVQHILWSSIILLLMSIPLLIAIFF